MFDKRIRDSLVHSEMAGKSDEFYCIVSQPSESTDYWEVQESYKAERESFLSVKKGQLVELLDDSGSNWMVLTIPMTADDLQAEGFLPAHLLKPVGMYIAKKGGRGC